MLKTWMSAGFVKVCDGTEAPEIMSNTFKLYMARNESESCLISLRSDEAMEGLSLVAERVPENIKVTFLKEYTLKTGDEYYPDPIVPMDGEFSIEANKSASFLVRLTTTEATKPLQYAFPVRLMKDGAVLFEYNIDVKVWKFAYPVKPTCETVFGLGVGGGIHSIIDKHGIDDKERLDEMYKKYFDIFLDYKTSADILPYSILDPRADEYMSDPRLTTFRVSNAVSDEHLKANYEKLATNPEWLKKAYCYPFDEPTCIDHLNTTAERSDRIHSIAPKLNCVTPFFRNPDYDENRDAMEFLFDHIDIFCPKAYCYVDKNIYSPSQLEKYPSFKDRMDKFVAEGKRVWWYVCWEPGDPYLNVYVNEQGINHRLLFWQQYLNNVQGFLYWATTWWTGVSDPWENMATVPGLSPNVFGDGSMLYNGNKVGIDGPVASLRLDIIRDGVEDFELLTMAAEKLGKEYVDSKIKELTPDIVTHTSDAELFNRVRVEIGNALNEKY